MTNVLSWVNHPELSRTEEMLIHIANLRRPTAAHLAALMGVKPKSIVQNIYLLNKEVPQTIQSMKIKKSDSVKVYSLGKRACQLVEEITGEKIEYYEFSKSKDQSRHMRGLNAILVRMVEKGGLVAVKEHCTWWNTRGAKLELFDAWKQLEQWDITKEREEFKTMLSPDARFQTGPQCYWVEYDNGSKQRRALWRQFELYIVKLNPIGNIDPIIWVCVDERRRAELQRWWEAYRKDVPVTPELNSVIHRMESQGKKLYLPHMHFFAPGEETTKLLTGRI